MKKITKIWIKSAEEDKYNQKYMFDGHRYSMSIYFAHQSVEKILKAYILEFKAEIPKRTHDFKE